MRALFQWVLRHSSEWLIGKLGVPLLLFVLFFSSLTGNSQLAFRDVGHFYTPLYGYVAERCAQDKLPLWNPLDQTGIPLLGETTTAVLYPLRYLVFSLPLATGTAMTWYVALHLWIASLTAWKAARWFGISRRSANLASIAYPLSGSVLFLYTNPPFLVAASWMPLVLGASLNQRTIPTTTRFLVIAFALSMMVLGGDPQTALHAVSASSFFLIGNRLFAKNRDAMKTLATLAAACVFAALLSLPQLAASISWTHQSYRALNDETQLLWTPPAPGSQQYDAFSYSMPPWHFAELCLPRAFGDLFPTYHRWSVLLPGDGRVWTPSIYVGLFAFLAVAWTLVNRRFNRWMAVAVFSALCSMGHFGFVWLLSQLTSRFDQVDSAVGGPYWFLYHFFPGYDAFRYPTKWLPFLSLGLAIQSSHFLDRTNCPRYKFPQRSLIVIASGLVFAAMAFYWFENSWEPTNRLPRDRFWGPLVTHGNGIGVHVGLVTLGAIAFTIRQRNLPARRQLYISAIIVITAIDLSMNGYHLIATVDQSQVALASTNPDPLPNAERWIRTSVDGGFPKAWREHSSSSRMLEVEASQRATWFGRWHLEQRAAVFNNMTSIGSNASTRFWQATNSWSAKKALADQAKLWGELRRWLAIDGVIVTDDQAVRSNGLELGKPDFMVDSRSLSSVRLHLTWKQRLAEQATKSRMLELIDERFRRGDSAVVNVYGAPIDSKTETVPTDVLAELPQPTLVCNDSDCAIITVSSSRPVLLTRAVLQDGHWNAILRSHDGITTLAVDVLNVDHLAQGAIVPAGEWDLTFYYRPASLTATLAIAALAWLTWLTLAVRGPATTAWSRVRLAH